MLEGAIEVVETADDIQRVPALLEAKTQALDFIHEMGWLLHRSHVKFRLGHMDPNQDVFPFKRFKWLMEFSMDHDWCAVVKKLLGILFEGAVGTGEHPSVELALLDLGLLHRAVRRNCRPMVELLLRFVPDKVLDKSGSQGKQQVDKGINGFLFKPDILGPAGLTPLHIAASKEGSENVLDALTDDPGLVSPCLLAFINIMVRSPYREKTLNWFIYPSLAHMFPITRLIKLYLCARLTSVLWMGYELKLLLLF